RVHPHRQSARVKLTFSLRARLTVFYTVIFGVLLMTIGIAEYRALARQLDDDATANLDELTKGLHGYLRIEDGEPTLVYDDTDPEEAAFVQRATRFYQVYNASTGKLLVQSDGLAPMGVTFAPDEVRSFRENPRLHTEETDYGRIRLSNSLINDDAGAAYLLQVGLPLTTMDAALQHFVRLLMWSVPIGLFLAIMTGRWMARLALAPLTRLATAARAIDVTNPRERLPIRGAGDELDTVARAFNETLERIENVMGEMRQFSTALAHELRSPIAALRGEIELAAMKAEVGEPYRQSAASQLEELDKLKRLIDQLLTLARAEAGQIPLSHQRVELAPLVTSVVEQVEAVAEAAGLELRAEIVDQAAVNGDAGWLERLLLNLLDNAFKFTDAGGRVVVRLTADEEMAQLEVRDSGVGMTPDVVPHVMERFYRADPARSPSAQGVGLGLSLVKWIVDRHHGSIEVESQPGRGSSFRVKIKKI
ncbi:MAG TPA: ATP-binding protein, partial [Vicinamibacterales bacterium]